MTIQEMTDRVHSLGNAWEQFKHVNDARLNELERKGYADPLYTEHLQKISDALDGHKRRIDQIETVHSRPGRDMSAPYAAAPKGILSYAAGTSFGSVEQVASGTASTVTADGLIKLYYALKDEYSKRATFLMHRNTVQAVRLLKEATTNQYLWQPGLAAGTPDTLLGVPVVLTADMPVPAASSLSVALGDFKRAYMIVDRVGIRTLRDPYTAKPFVKFYTTKRVGGKVVNSEAVKLLKLAAS